MSLVHVPSFPTPKLSLLHQLTSEVHLVDSHLLPILLGFAIFDPSFVRKDCRIDNVSPRWMILAPGVSARRAGELVFAFQPVGEVSAHVVLLGFVVEAQEPEGVVNGDFPPLDIHRMVALET